MRRLIIVSNSSFMLKRLFFGGVGLALLVTPLLALAQTASDLGACTGNTYAMSESERQSCLNLFLAKLAQLVQKASTLVLTGQGVENIATSAVAVTVRAAPASKPYCHNFPDFRLDVGDSGDEIIALKKALSRVLGEGYMQPANPKQNYYDEITAENVKELQSKNGIVTTGNVGSRTRSLLNRLVVCPSTPRTTQPTTQPKAEPTTQQASSTTINVNTDKANTTANPTPAGGAKAATTSTITGTVVSGSVGTVNVTYANLPASSANYYIQLIDQETLNPVQNAALQNVKPPGGNAAMSSIPTGTYILRVRRIDSILSQPVIAESPEFTLDISAAAGSVPRISSFIPNTVTSGVSTKMIIRGSGFRKDVKFVFSGASNGSLPTNYVSSQRIDVGPYSWSGAIGTHSFYIENIGGQKSDSKTFTINPPVSASDAAGSAITISSFNPTAATAGVSSNIVINGFNFPRNAELVSTNVMGVTSKVPARYISSQELRVEPYTWHIGLVGDYTFRVRDKDTLAMSEPSATFRVIAPASNFPFITSISPSILSAGQTNFTINGYNFQNGATVSYGNSIGNSSSTFVATIVSSSRIDVIAKGLASSSSYMVYVKNPGGQKSAGCETYAFCASTFSVVPPISGTISQDAASSISGNPSSLSWTSAGATSCSVQYRWKSRADSSYGSWFETGFTGLNSPNTSFLLNTPGLYQIRISCNGYGGATYTTPDTQVITHTVPPPAATSANTAAPVVNSLTAASAYR